MPKIRSWCYSGRRTSARPTVRFRLPFPHFTAVLEECATQQDQLIRHPLPPRYKVSFHFNFGLPNSFSYPSADIICACTKRGWFPPGNADFASVGISGWCCYIKHQPTDFKRRNEGISWMLQIKVGRCQSLWSFRGVLLCMYKFPIPVTIYEVVCCLMEYSIQFTSNHLIGK